MVLRREAEVGLLEGASNGMEPEWKWRVETGTK